jgi:hypothetical protein
MGLAIQEIMMLLGTSSSGVYEVLGVPLIPIFKEVTGIATESGVPDWALHQKEIRNDWCNTVEECTEVAKLELYWEVAQARPRTVTVVDDYRVEVGDLIQLPNGRKLWVESSRKTLGRGSLPALELTGYLVPLGV